MVTIKSFTSLEQSEKLAEILPLESADACWTNHLFGDLLSSFRVEGTPPQEYKHLLDRFIVKGYIIEPAWSLAALLSVLPKIINNESLFIATSPALWHIGYRNVYISRADNLVDACYKMVLKLNELNLL